ncbi:ATP-binding cassette domain-containing protein [Maribellus comscasis]|uniref:ATP-binding cassette domain-containing protein n=1 Tax=Maribellus comscasis TaxID=2681766 RepID=A0A6I6JZL7_9BACT|nr:ATP-binding cassette domain-containing protein [Maribellus comscasis]QGY46749.1 ATP-binding cassette domain-containing protein [Maribellus comscasis]
MKPFISLQKVLPLHTGNSFSSPVNWEINAGEIWTVLGNNGSGKSLLANILLGKKRIGEGSIEYHYFEEIKRNNKDEFLWPGKYISHISFETINAVTNFRGRYYQQRFNSQDADLAPFVSELFDLNKTETKEAVEMLGIGNLLDRRIISLSNGEQRKLVIAKILSEKPRMIIFENPYIGLDKNARNQINTAFPLLRENGIQLIFLVPSVEKMPACTTNILEINTQGIIRTQKIENFTPGSKNQFPPEKKPLINWGKIPQTKSPKYEQVVQMDDIEISYGDVHINSDINWEIKVGEKWALLGPNGSGKSTLLSYIFADNPRAYAKKLALFDRKRGSGESIWDIKKHIGYISFEMALCYPKNVPCIKIVESGFYDSIGLYKKCSNKQEQAALHVLEELSLSELAHRNLGDISSGEQQMVLFARALVKNPALLILDEPFNGLDEKNKQKCTAVIDSFCKQPGKTLIFVTHYRDEIPLCVDKFLELKSKN